MSPAEIPDRRPLLYIIMGVVIAAIAVVLFWPQGDEAAPPTMVLTPESVRQASELATDVAVAADLPEAEDADVPGESFPVTDAKLPQDLDAPVQATQTAPAKTTTPQTAVAKPAATKPVSKPAPTKLETSVTAPSSTGDYVIYVGSYSERANAQRAASELQNKGIQAQVMDAGTKYRVAVGYFTSSAKAEAYAKTLESKLGLEYWVGEGR